MAFKELFGTKFNIFSDIITIIGQKEEKIEVFSEKINSNLMYSVEEIKDLIENSEYCQQCKNTGVITEVVRFTHYNTPIYYECVHCCLKIKDNG